MLRIGLLITILMLSIFALGCPDDTGKNTSAKDEQARTEANQQGLNKVQPAPKISWSLERDNLRKRFKLMNERTVSFYMYVFIEGDRKPIGYYQVNKVSSVNSQLTNPKQMVRAWRNGGGNTHVLDSPAEDGSYGTNGDGVFGFTPEDVYIEHNMRYIVSLTPLNFSDDVPKLNTISSDDASRIKKLLDRLDKEEKK